MPTIQSADKDDLVLIRKAAIYLRDKLLRVDRDGPLVKLLNREIDVITDELSSRKSNAQTQEAPRVDHV